MRVFIAEKPELAQAIADGLGGGSRRNGYFECAGGDRVTWCRGHMLRLLDPEEYDPKYEKWSMDDLPIVHVPWRKKPGKGASEQLKVILDCIKQASSIVHAGDPDEEGQLLVDEVLDYAKCRLPVQRVIINDNNTKRVKMALAGLRPNSEFTGMSASAEARSVGDQLYGYNLTRCYTLTGQASGHQGVLSVGRVQTAILGMVVRRTREHRNHQKAFYYTVTGEFGIGGIAFAARYQPTPNDSLDSEGRLADERQADGIATAVRGKPARLVSVDTQQKEQAAPLPFNLLKLQAEASRRFGIDPDVVMKLTQSLRDTHKLITYNRSDTEYLNEEHHEEAPAVLASVAKTMPELASAISRADPRLKSRAFNSSKVKVHHGIIPTEAVASADRLSEGERKIYGLIAQRYVLQFHPSRQYDQTKVVVECEGRTFAVTASVTTRPGWTALTPGGDAEGEEADGDDQAVSRDLRALKAGQTGTCTSAKSEKQETKPPKLYTMASLLLDLAHAANHVLDKKLRAVLLAKDKDKAGEHGGIGTSATRDSLIKKLFERQYLRKDGKNIVPTDTGFGYYDVLPDFAKYPDMTAIWYEKQVEIAAGKKSVESFVRELMVDITAEIERVKREGMGIKTEVYPCPLCKKPLRRNAKGAKGAWWGCTGYGDGCKFTCEDARGKPKLAPVAGVGEALKAPCPKCGQSVVVGPRSFDCSANCGFKLWRDVASRSLSVAEADVLIGAGKVGPLDGFVSSSKKKFSATLALGADFKASFDFGSAPRSGASFSSLDPLPSLGVPCPKCGGDIRCRGGDNPVYACEKGDFKLWRVVAGRALSDDEASKLIKQRELGAVHGFVSSKPPHAKFAAGLRLSRDLSKVEFVFEKR